MKITLVVLLCILTTKLSAQHGPVFPQPASMEQTTEKFVFDGPLTVNVELIPDDALPYLQELFVNSPVKLEGEGHFDTNIRLKPIQTFAYTEGYQLNVTNTGIEIQFSNRESLLNAFKTLSQLVQNPKELAGVRISDQPAFNYRGVHLDCSRHFFTIAEIKGFIDQIALLKFNKFHWHLTDDQGWRIEIKKYPKLTSVGAWRDSTLIGHFSKQPVEYEHQRYGGFYTQDEAKDLVKYARIRGIQIIPEIEMPGHASAAIAAYPELSCTEKQIPVVGTWGVFDDVFCSQEKTRSFLKDVLDEIMEIFPSQVIHIGGDESPKINWEKCPKCQAVIAANHLHSSHELQSFFIQDIEKHVNAKGRTIIGWDEILEGGLAPNAQVMSWQGVEGGIAAAKLKHPVVMTPTSHCYFDYYQSGHPSEPLAIGGYLPLEKVYQFDPVKGVEDEYKSYILGAQANLWTEYLPTMDAVEYSAFPRLVAMSEVLWTPADKRPSYQEFIHGLVQYQFPYFNKMGIQYSTACFEPKLLFSPSEKGLLLRAVSDIEDTHASIEILLDNEELGGHKLVHTNRNPIKIKTGQILIAEFPDSTDAQLLFYPTSISFSNPLVVKVTRKGEVLRTNEYWITNHLALGKNVVFDTPPNEKYNVNGNLALTDGITGETPWKGNQWLGFNTDSVRFTLDLSKKTRFRSVQLGYLDEPGSWIYAPVHCVIETSKNGKRWKKASRPMNKNAAFTLTKRLKTRYLRITTINKETIPQGLTGAGFTPWTFLDELIITK